MSTVIVSLVFFFSPGSLARDQLLFIVFIKENDNINATFIYNISKETFKKEERFFLNVFLSFFLSRTCVHFRTTVNRRTFVGNVGRTNEGRACEEVVTKHPAKSLLA